MRVRGRFAPSPTGGLHLGSALAALLSWLSVRSQNGTYIWRIEDIDGPRIVPGASEQQMEEARWLGLEWDEGPDVGGPHQPYNQSERNQQYEAALRQLATSERLFPCSQSRKDLRELASAPHGTSGLPAYPKELRPETLDADWYDLHSQSRAGTSALRFLVSDNQTVFEDLVMNHQSEFVAQSVGDFVLKRRDGVYAYQLAVVVDDIEMGITEVVRGADLLDSTARQIQLIEALGGAVPLYAHVPLIVDSTGEKLSKRNQDISISQLRKLGISPNSIIGWLAHSVGIVDEEIPFPPQDLVAQFAWDRVRSENILAPTDLVARLQHLAN